MNDNEKLIEEAAKEISIAKMHGEWSDAARAALAVFEKAHTPTGCDECHRTDSEHKLDCGQRHTPTDDERGALGTAIWSELEAMDISMNTISLDRMTNTLLSVVFDSGFRRPEVPEPKCEHGTSLTDLCEHVERLVNSEPQGEPSDDEQSYHETFLAVQEDMLSEPQGELPGALRVVNDLALAAHGANSRSGDADFLRGHIEHAVPVIRAALRAASAVEN